VKITTITFIPELLQKILSYHKENPKIIFKCALVSKSWCDTAIPFLWKKPFRFCYSTFQYKIVKVYIQFLSEEFLNEYDLNLENSRPPSYNYLSFLQELVYLTLYESLINLLKKQRSYKPLPNTEKDQDDQFCPSFHPSRPFMIKKVLPIMNELCNLFVRNGTKILFFNLSAPYVDCNCKWLPLNNYVGFSFQSLSLIQTFICDNNGYDFNEILLELSKVSKNILTMEIKKPQSYQNLSRWINLINSQKSLQRLKLENFFNQHSSLIASAIPSQYNSLKEVELVDCKFFQTNLLDELSYCPNLISLKIKDCTFIEKSVIIMKGFSSLKTFFISKSLLPQESFLSIIGQPSKLLRITLNLIDFFKYPKILPFVGLNCFQLKILDILLVEETFERIIPIMENCKSLEEVSIWEKFDWIGHEFYDHLGSYVGNYMDPNLVMIKISNRLPKNLRKFHFPQIFNFTLKEIQYFIQNAPNTLQDLKFYAIVNDKNDVIDLLKNFAGR